MWDSTPRYSGEEAVWSQIGLATAINSGAKPPAMLGRVEKAML